MGRSTQDLPPWAVEISGLLCFGFKDGKRQCVHHLRKPGGAEGPHTEPQGAKQWAGGCVSTRWDRPGKGGNFRGQRGPSQPGTHQTGREGITLTLPGKVSQSTLALEEALGTALQQKDQENTAV